MGSPSGSAALTRAVLVSTDATAGTLFSPTIDPIEVPLSKEWGGLLPLRQRVPVACDPADPEKYWLIDPPSRTAPREGVPGVEAPRAAGAPPPGPAPIELQIPAPTVGDYLQLLSGGAPSRLAEVPKAPLLQAFALRIEQLSLHEHERIARLARTWVEPSLIDRIRAVGGGMEYFAWQLEAPLQRLPRGVDGWRVLVLDATYVALMRAMDADAEMPPDTPAVFRRLVKSIAKPPSSADIQAMLRPFVTVCGPIPTFDVPPIDEPEAPYAARDEIPVASPAAQADTSYNTAGHASPRPAAEAPARGAVTMPRARPRWWQRKSSPSIDRLTWDAAIERHNDVLQAYVAYETDPHLILAYPAILDVDVASTQDFHRRSAHASALRTDTGPHDSDHAQAFLEAVTAMQSAWAVAERFARRTGRDYLGAEEARGFSRAAGLLRHAESADGVEAENYRRTAAEIMRAHVVPRVSANAVRSLERVVRGELEASPPRRPRPSS
ncbi:hypothetical protein [Cumulibacter soli]|uniref:hypothetical protein n=1 Tax=Cumulibacter soli TaxID=2546344 RepID=UPI001067E7F0|nr:hypothetical protein [Cumulibacter soli]